MNLTQVYVGLGGNVGDSHSILLQAAKQIKEIPGVFDLAISNFYSTTPVSAIPQDSYLNAVCTFKTSLQPRKLLQQLQKIENDLGRKKGIKNSPRVIDLDILLFGLEVHNDPDLVIPHPRWEERLFVLIPLFDLIKEIDIPDSQASGGIRHLDLAEYLRQFPNMHNETVTLRLDEMD
jgi:2-amino-4-hydroxy-6-hydroxymethyldihydropteridine diphosphokinase